MIAIVDYGVGNLFSLKASLTRVGLSAVVTRDAAVLGESRGIILPGVGAFADAMAKLRATGLVPALDAWVAAGRPLLGICLGMQMLFAKSHEFGLWDGLGYLPGEVRPLAPVLPKGLKVPHIGWNALDVLDRDEPLLRTVPQGAYVYYVHSYYATDAADCVRAGSEYGVFVPGVVRRGSVCGTQFHPEKSGGVGLSMLRAFGEGCL